MRAERRAGELLSEMAERGERAVRKNMKSQPATSKLADLGINKTQSSRWQKLAALPADKFEAKIENASKRSYDRIAQRFVKEDEIKRAQERHAKLIEHGCTVDDLVVLAESGKRFSVIYADPPWPWETFGPAGSRRRFPIGSSASPSARMPIRRARTAHASSPRRCGRGESPRC